MQPDFSKAVLAGLAAASLLFSACDRDAVETWVGEPADNDESTLLFTEEPLKAAADALRQQAGPPVSALSLLVYKDHAVLQAQNSRSPKDVLQYVYRSGRVHGPVAVKLLGTGKLDDNVFPLDAAKLDAIPALVRAAVERSNIPEGEVSRVLLRRNLPQSMDIQFRVFITNQRRDAAIDADKDGNIVK